MPAGEKRDASRASEIGECLDIGHRGARRLLEKDMFACVECTPGRGIPNLRRLTQHDGIQAGLARQHLVEIAIVRHAFTRGVTARDGHQLGTFRPGDGRDMLVAGNLAEPDEPDPDRIDHSTLTSTTRAVPRYDKRFCNGNRKASASISKMSPSSVFTPSLKDSVAVPKKCTCTSPGRRKTSYLKW